jgi:hypothetical protein
MRRQGRVIQFVALIIHWVKNHISANYYSINKLISEWSGQLRFLGSTPADG